MTMDFDCSNILCGRRAYMSWNNMFGGSMPVELAILSKMTKEEFKVVKFIQSIIPSRVFAGGLCGVCQYALVHTPEETDQAIIDIVVEQEADKFYAAIDRKPTPYLIALNPTM